MFESANNLLSKPFIGTVNHFDLIVERFLRRKMLLSSELKNDNLMDFSQKLGNTSTRFVKLPVIDETALPLHVNPDDECLRSTMEINYLKMYSLTYSSSANALISFMDFSCLKFGEIVYFEKSEDSTCLVNLFIVVNWFGFEECKSEPEVTSFVIVEY